MRAESPVPDVEAPRDCPLCPRLVALPARAARPRIPIGGTRRCRPSAIRDAWLAIVGLAPGMWGANRTGRPFTGDHAGHLLFETLLKFGLAEGDYRETPDDGLRLERLRHPQLGQMPAAAEQAAAGGGRDLPALLRGRAAAAAEGEGSGRARPDRA